MAEDRFYSFEEALKELRLKEEELKRLVSEGEIRAFRQGDTMRLRQSDVEALKKELTGGEVVDLGDVKEELVFEDDVDLDAGMATQTLVLTVEAISGTFEKAALDIFTGPGISAMELSSPAFPVSGESARGSLVAWTLELTADGRAPANSTRRCRPPIETA